MTGFLEIVLIAAVAQLTVLPGEKVQFIVAGLSTRYRPLLVVGAASSAFAGWTALEILFGEALQRALPGVVLDAATAALFLLFAVLLYRSAPGGAGGDEVSATDGGTVTAPEVSDFGFAGVTVGGPVGRFLSIFSMMAVGELGDKTQLVTIGLAAQYGAHPGIWVGEMAAIVPVSLANAYFFHHFSHRFDLRKAHYLGAAVFAFFGVDTVASITVGFSAWETVVETVSEILLAVV